MVPPAPGSSQEMWGLQPPLPTKISGPLPQPVPLLSVEEQAGSGLPAGSLPLGQDPFQGTREGWGMLRPSGRPQVLHPGPVQLSPAWILPTHSGVPLL